MGITLAFVPLMSKTMPQADAVVANLAKNWSDLSPATEIEEKDDALSFTLGDVGVIAAMMPAPIPWGDLEGPCATSILWKDAAAVLKKHTHHLIVTVNGDDEDGPVHLATRLTQVISAILATCPKAPGVYWGNAALVIPSKIFQDFAVEVLPEGPPLHIWVDFRVGPTGKGKMGGFTQGMSQFGLMELETESSPESVGDLRERLFGLASYLLENGPVIKDGDTIGADANEKIRVVYAKSAFGAPEKVMRLEYGEAKKKSWFGFGG